MARTRGTDQQRESRPRSHVSRFAERLTIRPAEPVFPPQAGQVRSPDGGVSAPAWQDVLDDLEALEEVVSRAGASQRKQTQLQVQVRRRLVELGEALVHHVSTQGAGGVPPDLVSRVESIIQLRSEAEATTECARSTPSASASAEEGGKKVEK